MVVKQNRSIPTTADGEVRKEYIDHKKRFWRLFGVKDNSEGFLKQQYENFNGSSSEGLDHNYDRLQKLISQLGNLAYGSNSTNTDSMSDAVIYSFFANQSNSPQLNDEDLQQMTNDFRDESVTSIPDVTTSEAKTSVSKPKYVSEPLIEDWISCSVVKLFKSTFQLLSVNTARPINTAFQNLQDNPQLELQEKGRGRKRRMLDSPANEDNSTVNTASIEDNVVDENIVYECIDDPNKPNLEEIFYSNDDKEVGAEADMKQLATTVPKKALYGLHQAPRAWYETLSTYLLENGFRRGTIDKTLFIKKDKDDILLVQVYVDDIIFRLMIGIIDVHTASRPGHNVCCLCLVARDSPFDLEAFFDSDYAGASLDWKSTTGGVMDPKSIA
ncbi:putative ribonuclease H-like domain-containing protein [Tanacetum coccineum]